MVSKVSWIGKGFIADFRLPIADFDCQPTLAIGNGKSE
jgi:hypothetical protein